MFLLRRRRNEMYLYLLLMPDYLILISPLCCHWENKKVRFSLNHHGPKRQGFPTPLTGPRVALINLQLTLKREARWIPRTINNSTRTKKALDHTLTSTSRFYISLMFRYMSRTNNWLQHSSTAGPSGPGLTANNPPRLVSFLAPLSSNFFRKVNIILVF
jgi:hypothetical protein